ncbi:DUF397 domain-containing protein [Actinokineospora bangkokensis]|uniref:DUF397 domain-containing protein n=1 Tax=Actinokineospora bangkokensis TaxID=1193682 RepID=A0A1Q9LU22_9PSEU|nr:DUF397 domain-containing protein [Actinokineospora bangkokensis]OLR95520.1 hypothetical protein BJP25_06930 [Actinokineospora bangkokensis]
MTSDEGGAARTHRAWRAAGQCEPNGDCVEVRPRTAGGADVRDSKNRGRGTLTFRHSAWAGFVDSLRMR